jgi:hypothetical protein
LTLTNDLKSSTGIFFFKLKKSSLILDWQMKPYQKNPSRKWLGGENLVKTKIQTSNKEAEGGVGGGGVGTHSKMEVSIKSPGGPKYKGKEHTTEE